MIINYLCKYTKLKRLFVKNMLFFMHIFTNKLTHVLTPYLGTGPPPPLKQLFIHIFISTQI